jgi:NAD(P)-dependent dehydrogenase (short-subunit alcohol dehydrogenase family)
LAFVDGADIDATRQVSHEPEGGALGFDGDLVVVTGGSRGIGAAISELFVSLGAHVISVSRTTPDTPRRGIDDMVADLGDDRAPDAIGARVEQEWGIPTVLVNNAGINLRSSLTEPAAPVMQLEFMVNAIAAARLISVIGGLMGTVGRGSVVNVGSVKATLPGRSLGYGMSKAALENLTRSAAALLGPQGIRVNAVAPGDVVSDLAPPDHGRAFSNPLRRAVTATDVAWAVAFLSSVQAGSITGVILQVDAGYGIGLSTSSPSEGS